MKGPRFFLAVLPCLLAAPATALAASPFVRGDINIDGKVDISDPIGILTFLFHGDVAIGCPDAADANDDSQVDLSDAIRLLFFLFSSQIALPAPYPACGPDPTDDALDCPAYGMCPSDGVPSQRLERLTRGINVTRPFWGYQWIYGDFEPNFARATLSAADMETILSLGFRHIRLPLADRDLFSSRKPSSLDPTMLSVLKEAVAGCTSRGLGVILDWHPEDPYKDSLQRDDGFVAKAALGWGALAAAFAASDPDLVFFEVLNEPVFDDGAGGYDAARWDTVLAALHEAIRAAAPEHTIIAGGVNWNDISGLEGMRLLDDRNVVYNFHYYEPFVFTHQGAEWGGEPWNLFHDVPYPSSPELVAPLLDDFSPNSLAWELLEWYGGIGADAAWLEFDIRRAARWAADRRVSLTCNEFGVYGLVCPRESLLAYHRDIIGIFERLGIGWCKWEYDEGFGVVSHPGGDSRPPAVDLDLIAAMGLPGN